VFLPISEQAAGTFISTILEQHFVTPAVNSLTTDIKYGRSLSLFGTQQEIDV
jgi:hypothetical protein